MASRSPRLATLLWSAAFLVLVLLGLKTFVADLYYVTSSSMEPTVFGGSADGETVVVQYSRRPVERFDLVVVQRAVGGDPVVKRVAGLPGETVTIVGGDLVIDGARLGSDARRPQAVPVYDPARKPLEKVFHFRQEPRGPWRPADASAGEGAWTVDGRGVDPGSNLGMMLLSPDVRDTYLHPDGKKRGGLHQVGDVFLELEVLADGAEGRLRFLLVEEGDTFEVAIEPGSGGLARARIERWVPGAPNAELVGSDMSWSPGEWHRVRFSNVDNNLILEVESLAGAGHLRMAYSYAANEPYPGTTQGADLSVGARTGFGAAGLEASFRAVQVARDLHYTQQGTYGVGAAVTLGLGEVFLLGDNSGDSRDSRFWGPVLESEVVGRPSGVVWPFAQRRWLNPHQEPLGTD